jgi:hypothetical protein
MRALSIRQPYAELILRGIKTAELRSRATSIVGERFYIYAAKAAAKPPIWSADLSVGTPPAWLVELAAQVKLIEPELLGGVVLPTGVIVGSAVIARIVELPIADCQLPIEAPVQALPRRQAMYRWELTDVRRLDRPRKPKGRPQPVWFRG